MSHLWNIPDEVPEAVREEVVLYNSHDEDLYGLMQKMVFTETNRENSLNMITVQSYNIISNKVITA